MQTIVSIPQYAELVQDQSAQRIFRENLIRLAKERGLWREDYAEFCKILQAETEIPDTYVEQAVHGRPIHRYLDPLCRALGVEPENMFAGPLAA